MEILKPASAPTDHNLCDLTELLLAALSDLALLPAVADALADALDPDGRHHELTEVLQNLISKRPFATDPSLDATGL